MDMKQHILAALEEQFDRWEEVLINLSDTEMTAPLLPSAWSIKDNLAHLWAWQQRTLARIEAVRLNHEPEYPHWPADLDPGADDVEAINAWIYETYRGQSWQAVHPNWRDNFQRLLNAAEEIPERDLLDSGKYPWLKGYSPAFFLLGTYDHHQEHLEELQAWLREQARKELRND
jgi:hypothetical protein